jgi:hypothetical protein
VTISGGPKRVSVYLLDWDPWGRAERVEVVNAGTGAVLDSRDLSGFQGGRYLSWDLAGHVLIRFTNQVSWVNAVASAVFFDPPSSAPPPTATAAFLGADNTTQGNWRSGYGADGYVLAQGASSLPSYAQLSLSGQLDYTWNGGTADVRALQKPGAADRLAATWYSGGSFTMDLNLTGGPRRVGIYLLDWDNWYNRTQRVEVIDAATGTVLDLRDASSFQGGRYLAWNLTGHVLIRVTNLNPSSNAVVSGIFFGGAATP